VWVMKRDCCMFVTVAPVIRSLSLPTVTFTVAVAKLKNSVTSSPMKSPIHTGSIPANVSKNFAKPLDFFGQINYSTNMETQYWIQEQAPAGNYFDSIGLDPATTEEQAISFLQSWKNTFPERKVRLVLKTTELVRF
jgi:hypothetical protein